MDASAEAWLMLLAAALYLMDSLLLLRPDELVLVQPGARRWRAAFGANGWQMAGKEPFLALPLAPWQALSRVRWQPEAALATSVTAPPQAALPAIGRLPRLGVTLLGALMFFAFPLCLFVLRQTAVTLAVIAAMYACIAFVLALLWRAWPALGLAPRRFWLTALECAACPPFAVNAVRRVSLLVPVQVSMAQIVHHEQAQGRLAELKRQLQRRVNEQIDAQPEGSPRLAALQAAARALDSKEAER